MYAQFFQQAMSQVDALSLKVIVAEGYQNNKFSREIFDTFIQGKQKNVPKTFFSFDSYAIYDRAYRVWNFLKHNSLKAYSALKSKYPEMIYDPNNAYKNGDLAVSVVKVDEKFLINTLDELPKFFDEVCQRGFSENPKDASWDYDDYFIQNAKDEIEAITNPLGIPEYL